jgi:hypothetical protein
MASLILALASRAAALDSPGGASTELKEGPSMEPSRFLPAALRLGVALGLALTTACNGAADDDARMRSPSTESHTAALKADESETPEAAAERRRVTREARRARIGELKAQIAAADERTAAGLLATYEAEMKESILETEGLSVPSRAPAPAPKQVSEVQRQRLLTKMKQFDMRKPADMAAWARIKHEELGR